MPDIDNVLVEDEGQHRNYAIIDPSELELDAYNFEVFYQSQRN